MLLKYEFCKHFTKFNILLAVFLLILNFGITVYQFRDDFTIQAEAVRETKQNLLNIYLTDKAEYDRLYEEYSKKLSEYNLKYYTLFDSGSKKSMPVFENVLISYPNYGDIKLFKDTENIIHASENYRQTLNTLLHETVVRIRETENHDSYTYRYYIQLINNYDPLADMSWDILPIKGWNEFFSLQAPSVFITLASLCIFCGAFTIDRRAGFSNVLNTAKKGGKETVLSKLAYVTISSVVLTSVYTLSPLIVPAISCGLSSLSVPIQTLDAFKYCRFEFSIGQYLVVYSIIRVIVFLCFSLAVAVIGKYFKNETPSYIFAVVLAVAGIILKNIDPESKFYYLNKFNIIDISNVNILFTKLNGLNIFNFFIDYTYFIILGTVSKLKQVNNQA